MRNSPIALSVLPAILIAGLLGGCGSHQGNTFTAAPPPSSTASAPPPVALAGGSRGFNVRPMAFKPANYGKK